VICVRVRGWVRVRVRVSFIHYVVSMSQVDQILGLKNGRIKSCGM
jgi:hypothetical protein